MKATRRRVRAALLVALALAALPLAAAAQSGGAPRMAAPKATQPAAPLVPSPEPSTMAPQPTNTAPQPTTQAPQPTTQAPQPTTQSAVSPPAVAVPVDRTPRRAVSGTAHRPDSPAASVDALVIDSEAPAPQPGALPGRSYPELNPPLDSAVAVNALAGGSPPPATLRAYAHVFVAFAVAWLLVFGYALSIGRRFGRLEAEVEKLERPG